MVDAQQMSLESIYGETLDLGARSTGYGLSLFTPRFGNLYGQNSFSLPLPQCWKNGEGAGWSGSGNRISG